MQAFRILHSTYEQLVKLPQCTCSLMWHSACRLLTKDYKCLYKRKYLQCLTHTNSDYVSNITQTRE